MSNVVVNIDRIECDKLEGLQSDINSLASLIAFMESSECSYEIPTDKIQNYVNKYTETLHEFNVIKEHISNKYKPEDISNNYMYTIDFRSGTITYDKQ